VDRWRNGTVSLNFQFQHCRECFRPEDSYGGDSCATLVWVVQNYVGVKSILALSQLDLAEGFTAKIN
jgi:hypothetical protein